MVSRFPYRADVDGLRAIAVVPVVLYHAGVRSLSGGFVGVDIFFVISGYLITSIITEELDSGQFSLVSFYQRRVRRILPALFAVLAFCTVVGWYILASEDYRQLGQSILATSVFSSNILFWREAGYFDLPLAEKPLLHTWSLAVEEQFYVVFPLYLIFIAKFIPRHCIRVTLMLAILSFLLSAVGVYYAPSAAFYLSPTRAWELLLGALLAMDAVPVLASAKLRNLASLAGLVLIIVSVFGYSKDTTFPGFAALTPVLGAAFLIWAGTHFKPVANSLLATRPFVFIGKISYSLYMWHFPILAFATYTNVVGLDATQTIVCVVVSSILAVLSWRFVEQPFRRKGGIMTRRQLFSAAAGASCAFAVVGLVTHLKGGFPGRFEAKHLAIESAMSDMSRNANPYRACSDLSPERWTFDGLCKLGATGAPGISVIVWGNSHAIALAPGIDAAAARSGKRALFAAYTGCRIAIGIRNLPDPDWAPLCGEFNDAILNLVLSNSEIADVVLVARWADGPYRGEQELGPQRFMSDESLNAVTPAENWIVYGRGFERLIARLSKGGKRIWIVGPVPEIGYDVPRTFHLQSLGFLTGVDIRPTAEEFFTRQALVFGMLDGLSKKYAMRFIWPHEALCGTGRCEVQREGQLLYSDDDHMSMFGARIISMVFDPIFIGINRPGSADMSPVENPKSSAGGGAGVLRNY